MENAPIQDAAQINAEKSLRKPAKKWSFWPTNKDEQKALLGIIAWLIAGAAVLTYVITQKSGLGKSAIIAAVWLLSITLFAPKAVSQLFGPVFMYELSRLAKRKSTFVLRNMYVVIIVLIMGVLFASWLVQAGYWDGPGFISPKLLSSFGEQAFNWLAPIQFIAVVLLTPGFVAGVIADERERRTLDYLFTTDLKNREIVFGKLASRLILLTTYILAGLPILACIMLFGGIDPVYLFNIYAGTFITIIVLASFSIWISTHFKKPGNSIIAAYIFVLLYYIGGGLLFINIIGNHYSRLNFGSTFTTDENIFVTCIEWLGSMNPLVAVYQIASPRISAPLSTIAFRFVVLSAVLIAFFLFSTTWRLRSEAKKHTQKSVSSNTKKGTPKKSKPLASCDNNPVYWNEVYVLGSRTRRYLKWFAFYVSLVVIFVYPFYVDVGSVTTWARLTLCVLSCLMILCAAARGSAAICGEKDRDSWITLISTPLTTWQILFGKWAGAILSTKWLFGLYLIVMIMLMACKFIYPPLAIPQIFYLLVYVAFSAALGVYFSCSSRKTMTSTIKSVLATIFFMGGYWLLLLVFAAIPGIDKVVDDLEFYFVSLLAFTPMRMTWWFIMPEFTSRYIAPFSGSSNTPGYEITYFAFIPFLAMTMILLLVSYFRIQRESNRYTFKPKKPEV
jgi:ABC-type transport system involved in multi-copper enzyme maturation permease subunit